jgi:GT2 family glycosyltransferase
VGPANHGHKGLPADSAGYFGRLLVVYNYAAVTGACLMVKKCLYLETGGLDERLSVAYNDVDFCLRLLKKGYQNVVLPQARLYHHESGSRGSDRSGENQTRLKQEAVMMNERWTEWIRDDPFYSPHLTRDREDFTLQALSFN